MKKQTKKRILIAVAVLLLLAVLAAGGGALYLRSLPSPLAEYDFTGCTVELYAKWADATYAEMTEVDTEVFKNGLQGVRVFPLEMRNPPDGVAGGPLHQFRVRFSDGSTLDIGVVHDSLILGEKWYRCDPDTTLTLYWLERAYAQYSDLYDAPASAFEPSA